MYKLENRQNILVNTPTTKLPHPEFYISSKVTINIGD